MTATARGVLLCCLSALCFGLIGPVGRQAFAVASFSTVLGWRFLVAALVLWAVVLMQHRPVGRGRARWQPFAMGALLYASQSALNLLALRLLPVGLTSLLLYTMPVMVVVVAFVSGREPMRPVTVVALGLAVGGVALAVLGPTDGAVSTLGVLLDLGSAVLYTGYYFAMAALPDHVDPLSATAWVCTGAAVSHLTYGVLSGRFDPTPSPAALLWIVGMAVVCTVVPISLLMVGSATAGVSNASVVSCLEPIVAVVLGAAVLSDPFGPTQLGGTAGVVAAVVLLGRFPTDARSGPRRRRAAEN